MIFFLPEFAPFSNRVGERGGDEPLPFWKNRTSRISRFLRQLAFSFGLPDAPYRKGASSTTNRPSQCFLTSTLTSRDPPPPPPTSSPAPPAPTRLPPLHPPPRTPPDPL